MMHRSVTLLALGAGLLALTGCPQDPPSIQFDMSDYFAVDSGREWTFQNMDVELDYQIVGILDPTDIVEINGIRTTRIAYTKVCVEGVEECGAGPLYDIFFVDDGVIGAAILGYENPAQGRVEFANPLVIGRPKMGRGETAESVDVDGHTFTSNFFDLELDGTILPDGSEIDAGLGCDQDLNVEWECAHFIIESDPPGHWLAGDWWTAPGYHAVAWKRSNDDGKWRTIRAGRYTPTEDTEE